MSDLLKALNGGKGELDAWLETQNEAELRTAILDFISPQETLRDKFAAKAMQGLLSGNERPNPKDGENWKEAAARVSYELADAMIKARKS